MCLKLRDFLDNANALDLSYFTWDRNIKYYMINFEVSRDENLLGWIRQKGDAWKAVLLTVINGKKSILLDREAESRTESVALMSHCLYNLPQATLSKLNPDRIVAHSCPQIS